ncbi:MAG: hypothetical protein SFT92_02555 [Rickettsiales bacterium]|nr:hypothetical protein [Rickettsiales bacterium]
MNNFEVAVFMELKALCLMALDALQVAEQNLIHKREISAKLNAQYAALSPEEAQTLVAKAQLENAKLFRNIHSFLSCCGNISKLIWLNPKSDIDALRERNVSEERVKEIDRKLEDVRTKLGLVNTSTFHWRERGLRNHIEHYSVRLFALMAETGNMSSYKTCLAKDIDQRSIGTTAKNDMRTFVVDTKEYIFQGEAFDLGQMEQDIEGLLKLIDEKDPLRPPLS